MIWKVSGSASSLTLAPYKSFSSYNQQITRMAGLELYGFYVHTLDTSNLGHLYLLQLFMNVDATTGLLPVSGIYTENTASTTTTEQTYMVNSVNLDQWQM